MSTCNINYTTKTLTQDFVGTIKILTWSPLLWTIDFEESITGKILYNISGLIPNTTYFLTKYNYDGTINQSFNITTDATGKYSISTGTPKVLIEGNFPVQPTASCNINYTTKTVTQDFVGTVTIKTWNPLDWMVSYNEDIYGKITYNIYGLLQNTTYTLQKYLDNFGTPGQMLQFTTDLYGNYTFNSGSPEIKIDGNFPIPECIPHWTCEQPLNGYETDSCGNRRINTNCECNKSLCDFIIIE